MKTKMIVSVVLDCPVVLEQTGMKTFRVTYGAQVKDGLTYGLAAEEFGYCVMHSAVCAGLVDVPPERTKENPHPMSEVRVPL